MRIRRRSAAQLALVAVAVTAIPTRRVVAQGSLIDRAKKSMTDAASAAKKGLSDETTRQINSAIDAAATAEVSDGSFNAAVSPWTSSDGAKRVELARFSGSAFVVTNGASRQIVLCDDRGLLPWLASVTIADGKSSAVATSVAPGTAGAPGSGRGSGTPGQVASTGGKSGRGGASGGQPRSSDAGGGRGGAPTSGTPAAGAAATAANGEVVQAGAKGASMPTAVAREYRLPSNVITLALPTANGANVGAPSVGSLNVASVSESIFSGAAKVRFAQATIPGSKTKETVDLGVVFKARVLAEGQTPGECLTSGGGKGGAAAKGGDATPGDTKGGDANGSPSRGSQPASPTTPARGATAAAGTGSAGGASFAEGDVLLPKIANVKLIADSKDDAKLVATLTRGEELVYLGQEQNGYLHVQAAGGEGWVRKALLSKR